MCNSKKVAAIAAVGLLFMLNNSASAQSDSAFRLIEPSERFDLKFSLLNRFDFLDGQFRLANNGSSDQLFTSRLLVDGTYRKDSFTLNIEIADTRQALADEGTPVHSRTSGALDLQQLYATWRWQDVGAQNDDIELKVGRQTLDYEARRLIARTMSIEPHSFTGFSIDMLRNNGDRWSTFHFAPVLRYPDDRAGIIDNAIEWNEESEGARLSGVFAALPNLIPGLRSEWYAFHLEEKDTGVEEYADLSITTFGTRIFKVPADSAFDFEIQTAWQIGESRASAASSDTRDLDHRAAFYHVEVGYTFDVAFKPRLHLLYDYASGDKDPFDNENNRFDSLFGARRSDFGQTSIYGPFSRTNLATVGVRAMVNFHANLNLMVFARDLELASTRDSWGGTGWRDSTGRSGADLGRQFEARLRWNAVPRTLAVDTGITWLRAGKFAHKVSSGQAPSMTRFVYFQTLISF